MIPMPTAHIVCAAPTDGQRNAEWLRQRRNGIGASEAAALFGEHPYTSAYRLWLLKIGEIGDSPAGPAAKIGKLLEPIMLQHYWPDDPGGLVTTAQHLYRHNEHAWLQCTPDGFTDYDGIFSVVELKTIGFATWGSDGPPPHVVWQVQHQMACLGLEQAVIGCLHRGSGEWSVHVVRRDQQAIDALIDRGSAFWRTVLDGGPAPAPDGDVTTVRERYPSDSGGPVIASQDVLESLHRYDAARTAVGVTKLAAAVAQADLLEHIGDAPELIDGEGRILATYRADKRGRRTLRIRP